MDLRPSLRLPPAPFPPVPWGAWMIAVVNAGMLWWFCWVQILIGVFVSNGVPAMVVGYDSLVALETLHAPCEPYPWTVAEVFLAVGIVLSLFCTGSTWVISRGERGCWRMRVFTGTFAVVLLGYSSLILAWKDEHRRQVESWIERMDRGSPNLWLMDMYWGGERQRGLDALERSR